MALIDLILTTNRRHSTAILAALSDTNTHMLDNASAIEDDRWNARLGTALDLRKGNPGLLSSVPASALERRMSP